MIPVAITPINVQNTSATSLQNQEQQLLNQIKNLQTKDKDGNAAQIKVLQNKYNAILLQQQQAVSTQPQQKALEASAEPSASPVSGRGINIKV